MLCCQLIQLCDSVLRVVMLEPIPVAAECVGQHDVRAGIEVIPRHLLDGVRCVCVHQLRAAARFQAVLLQIGTGGTIEDEQLGIEAIPQFLRARFRGGQHSFILTIR